MNTHHKPTKLSPRSIKRLFLAGIFEFGPVLLFIFSFEYFHIYKATIILMITTIISTVTVYVLQKRLPYLALYVAFLTSVFGYITLVLHEPKFIQMRDTLYDITCAITLIIGILINIPFLKIAFQKVLPMTDWAWEKLTYAWIGYFIFASVANEYVRRTMSLSTWFDFKTLIIGTTIVYGLFTLYVVYEEDHTHLPPIKEDKEE